MDLKEDIITKIIEISKKHQEIEKVVLFGSRARGDNSTKSDIDLAIYSNKSIYSFIEDVELNTRTLLEFDFSDMNLVKDEFFIEQVKNDGVVLYEKC